MNDFNLEVTQDNYSLSVSDDSYAMNLDCAVNVEISARSNLQTKTKTYTPTESAQSETVEADEGFDGLESVAVTVDAVSPSYVGTGVARRSSSDLSASEATVTAPAGYYQSPASKSVASGTAGTPTATKGTVSNHSVTITPSVTNTTGYINGSTKTGTAVTVSASELVSGSQAITENGTVDVTNLASVTVNVSGSSSSPWTHILTQDVAVSTTSTSAATAATIQCGSAIFTKDKIVWVHIRDKAGKRAGYFYGSDTFFVNVQCGNGSTSTNTVQASEYIRVSSSGTYAAANGQYGVWGYSISSAGALVIRRRYNSSNTLTIDGTFQVDVYTLDLPDNLTLFD